MRFSTIVGIFTVMLTLVPGLVFAEDVIDDSKEPSYRFVLRATSGSLKGDTLTLNGVPNVIYFSDRKPKKERVMSISKFIEMWDKGVDNFKADPPNATLSVLKKEGDKNAQIDRYISFKSLDEILVSGDTIVFKVALLHDTPLVTQYFKIASLFIYFNNVNPSIMKLEAR